jgi:hypothetical protein
MKTTVDSKILTELKKRSGLVSTVRLGHVSNSFAVHSAISRLRKQGHNILCLKSNDQNKKAWYVLA